MSETSALIEALRGHYLKPGDTLPGGVFLTELTDDASGRRIDALHIGFYRSRGRMIDGHEVKVSRSDWLRELAEPGKAETWWARCHRWWIVTPSTGIVRAEEVPDGWGLLVPKARGRVFRVVVEPALRAPVLDIEFLVQVAARLDKHRADADVARVAAERKAAGAEHTLAMWQEQADTIREGTQRLRKLDLIETAYGGPVPDSWDARPADLGRALRLLMNAEVARREFEDRVAVVHRNAAADATRLAAAAAELGKSLECLGQWLPKGSEG